MLFQCREWDNLQGTLVGRCQHHRRGDPVVGSPQPVASRDTPSVPGLKSGKHVEGSRCYQIVADAPLVLEELSGDDRADGMAAEVGVVGVARPIPHPACQGIAATGFEFAAENVASSHAVVMAS